MLVFTPRQQHQPPKMTNTISKFFISGKDSARELFDMYYYTSKNSSHHSVASTAVFGNKDRMFEIWFDLYTNGNQATLKYRK